jgi:integrase
VPRADPDHRARRDPNFKADRRCTRRATFGRRIVDGKTKPPARPPTALEKTALLRGTPMPKRRTSELVRCVHFSWLLVNRNGTWYADGRSNSPSIGRHSLGTSDKSEALQRLPDLDRQKAEDIGRIPRSSSTEITRNVLLLADGRKLYEKHIGRPRSMGGVSKSTAKRYRTTFDKFLEFCKKHGHTAWNGVTDEVLTAYVADLDAKGYANKSQINELTTLMSAYNWLIRANHLASLPPIKIKLRRAESQSAYCWRPEEIRAMVEYCRAKPRLEWLGNAIIALACTGLRIAELASLRWIDLDLAVGNLMLTDESGYARSNNGKRRELKSGRSRTFPIHPDFMAVLKRLPRPDEHVFHGPRGGRLKPDTMRRILVRDVIMPLTERFSSPAGQQGFKDGRLHSFRHAFCSRCANSGVAERIVMAWLGHNDSEMIRTYYHLHDAESKRKMNDLDFLGGAGGRSVDATESGEMEESSPTS